MSFQGQPADVIKNSFSHSDAINFYKEVTKQGLFPPEKIAFESYLKPGLCLDIGCGTRREAIRLAKTSL